MKPDSTLARMLRALTGSQPDTVAPTDAPIEAGSIDAADVVVEAESQAVAELKAELDAFKASTESIVEDLNEKLSSALADVGAISAEKATIAAELAKATAEVERLVQAAADAKLSARHKALSEVLGDAKATGLMSAVGGLQDAEFSALLEAFASSAAVEAKTKMFTEVGASAETDVTALVAAPSKEMQILQAKYGQKS